MLRPRPRTLLPPLLAAVVFASGCLLAAGGAAAGGGVYYTTRGAEAIVHGDVEDVTRATRHAFEELGVRHQGHRDGDDGESRQVFGAIDEDDVTVRLHRRTANATRVEVRVQVSAVTWDKEMAEKILQDIRSRREG